MSEARITYESLKAYDEQFGDQGGPEWTAEQGVDTDDLCRFSQEAVGQHAPEMLAWIILEHQRLPNEALEIVTSAAFDRGFALGLRIGLDLGKDITL